MTESNERTNTRTNEHTNGRTDKRQGENYIPRGINAGGITMDVMFNYLRYRKLFPYFLSFEVKSYDFLDPEPQILNLCLV